MDDASQRQQYKINAMHGHDVGVWVCEGSGISLSPVLFMQALCPEPAPRPLLVKWKSAAAPPKAFKKGGALPLIYSECGRLPSWPYHVHVFAPQTPVAHAVEKTNGLQDWSWAVPIVGIILIFSQKYDRPPASASVRRLFGRTSSPQPNSALAWIQRQQLPYVVAALGYEAATTPVEQLRTRYDLADVPIVSGPDLADVRRQKQGTQSGMFSSVFEHQQLAFDREYARTVLSRLFQQIER